MTDDKSGFYERKQALVAFYDAAGDPVSSERIARRLLRMVTFEGNRVDITLLREYESNGDPGWIAMVPAAMFDEAEAEGAAHGEAGDHEIVVTLEE